MIIDCHAHILPRVDHGCESPGTAKLQLEAAVNAGVDVIVASSHFYPDKELLDTFLKRREEGIKSLNSMSLIRPRILIGAEATVCIGMQRLENLDKLCIGDTKCILLEMPFINWNSEYIEAVKGIRDELGLIPLMAHIDRYPEKEVKKLLDLGVYCQINAESLCSIFHRRRLIKWIDQGHIYALGSDIHGTESGYANFLKAKKLLGARFDTIMRKSAELLGIYTTII